MGHDEGNGLPVLTERYITQLQAVDRLGRWIGGLLLFIALVAAIVLAVKGQFGPAFWWAVFLVVYGGCIVKASEEWKKTIRSA
ncbi:hypothetical protein ACFLU6_10205 [Acidobacteriota bacterium]